MGENEGNKSHPSMPQSSCLRLPQKPQNTNVSSNTEEKTLASLQRQLSQAKRSAENQFSLVQTLLEEIIKLKHTSSELNDENDRLINEMQDAIAEHAELKKGVDEVAVQCLMYKDQIQNLKFEKAQLEEPVEKQLDELVLPDGEPELVWQRCERLVKNLQVLSRERKDTEKRYRQMVVEKVKLHDDVQRLMDGRLQAEKKMHEMAKYAHKLREKTSLLKAKKNCLLQELADCSSNTEPKSCNAFHDHGGKNAVNDSSNKISSNMPNNAAASRMKMKFKSEISNSPKNTISFCSYQQKPLQSSKRESQKECWIARKSISSEQCHSAMQCSSKEKSQKTTMPLSKLSMQGFKNMRYLRRNISMPNLKYMTRDEGRSETFQSSDSGSAREKHQRELSRGQSSSVLVVAFENRMSKVP